MRVLKIAGMNICVKNLHSFTEQYCEGWFTESDRVDFTVVSTPEKIEAERRLSDADFSDGYLESIAVYREICMHAPEYGAFIMHCAVVEADGRGYAFAATSGTGKSTHISLWRKLLGNRVKIVNGDKPIIRFENGIPYAYGTPWRGKEGWGENTRTPLTALCFLERAETNSIIQVKPDDMVLPLMNQVFIPRDPKAAAQSLELFDRLLKSVRIYRLGCNMDISAAEVSFNAMSREPSLTAEQNSDSIHGAD